MKTLILKLNSQSNSKNYDTNGSTTGGSNIMNFTLVTEEDDNTVGSANFNFNINCYNNLDEELKTALETLNSKIQDAINAFNLSLTGSVRTILEV